MKMTQEHYTTLKNAIQALGIERTSAIRIWSRKTCDEKPKLNFDKLFRHTMLYDAVRSKWVCDELYPYLDDTHIDTALRRIVKDLNL